MATGSTAGVSGEVAAMPRRNRGRRLLLIGAAAVMLLLILAVALAPTIGSAMAPGMIEGAVNPDIQGRVKVHKASIGWFSGLEAGPIEVYDPSDVLVASVSASAPVTLWQAVSGRYWAARSLNLGTVEVAGKGDIRQYNDGTTNLDRALASRDPAKAKPAKPTDSSGEGGEPPAVKATIKVTQFDVGVRHERDNFASEVGLKQLKGQADINADLAAEGGGVIKAVADFAGTAVSPAAGAAAAGGAGATALKLDADVKQKPAGGWSPEGIEHADVKLMVSNAPIAVADALGSFGGALVQGVGPSADVDVDVAGNAAAMAVVMQVRSEGLNADTNLELKDGVLVASAGKPNTVSLRSTEFVQNLPAARQGVNQAARQVKLTQAPSVEMTLESLRIPIGAAAGGNAGAEPPLSARDFRGASLVARVRVSGMSGQVLLPEAAAAGGGGPAGAGATGGTWKPFAVEPVELAVNIADLARPVSITTGTRATLDGRPAGDLSLSVNAEGLLDAQGRVRALAGGNAGFADKAEARVRIAGMSTALAQPVLAGVAKDLPLDLPQDVGPTLDVDLLARADVAGVTDPGAVKGLGALPPLDVTGAVASRNIRANIDAQLNKAMLTTSGEGLRLTIDSAAPLAQRILAASREAQLKAPGRDPNAAPPPRITLTGAGKVEIAARDVAISLNDTSPAAILSAGKANASVGLSDLSAAMDMGGNTSPVRIERYALTAQIGTVAYPKVAIDGQLSHENQPFTITGGYEFNKLEKGLPTGSGPAQLVALKPVGAVEVKGLPRTLLGIVPALGGYASAAGVAADATEQTRQLAAAVRDAIGPTADLTLRTIQAPADKGGGQYVATIVKTAGDGAYADVWLRVTENLAEISAVNLYARPDPRWMNPLLANMTPPPAEGQPAAAPMRLGAPVKLTVTVDKPAKIPLVTGADKSVAPDWSKADELTLKIGSSGELVVENVPTGGGGVDDQGRPVPARTAVFALRNVAGEVRAPLSGIPDEARARSRASVKMAAAAFNRAAGDASLGRFDLAAQANMDGSSPDATVTLAGVSTAAIGALTGQQDTLVGALGETANATLRIKPAAAGVGGTGGGGGGAAGQVLAIDAELTSPRVSGAKLSLAKDDTHLWLTQPSTITWDPNLSLINKLFAPEQNAAPAPPAPGQPARPARRRRPPAPAEAGAPVGQPGATVALERSQPITINFSKLALAMGGGEGEAEIGPLKPGVFEVDLAVQAPSMAVNVASGKAGQPPTKMAIEGLNLTVRAPRAAANVAPAPLVVDLVVDKVTGAATRTGKKSTANIQISNLADARGVVNAAGALVNADVDVEAFPTTLVDNLANQNGLLTELLGPTVSVLAKAREVSTGGGAGAGGGGGSSATAGTLNIDAASPRASARIVGQVREGRFVQSGPVSVQLREIRTQLVEVLAGGLPLVQSLEKTPQDEPATITTEGLTVPLDNDLRKLGGKVTIDPGVARFTTNNIFGQIVKGLGGRDAGSLGRKIEPFVVNIDKGVATYERFNLPVGEFALATRGQVDLVNNTMNVVTYVPFFALSDEAAGRLNLGLAGKIGVFDRTTMVPITSKGSLDNPETKLDIELFLKETGENLIKTPGNLIDQLLKPKGGDKK